MKKRLMAAALTSAMAATMAVPAFAANTSTTDGGAVPVTDGTHVYAGVIIDDPDAKIKVEVPTLFAFVVNGSVTTDATSITKNDGTLILPNVKVSVNTPSGTTGQTTDVSLQTVGSGALKFSNYSTKHDANGPNQRAGLAVSLLGTIKNEGSDVSRNYWKHVADGTTLTGDAAKFKQYTLEVNGQQFNTSQNDGSLGMAAAVNLDAPRVTAATDLTRENYAKVPAEVDAIFNVYVGGQKGQYSQIEESAKVGSIVWTVNAQLENVTADTAPNNSYLQQPAVGP